jgi:translation initiation factor IF-3
LKDKRFNNRKKDFVPINHQIRSPKVRCINVNNENIGVIDTSEAISTAKVAGLDLIQVAPGDRDNPPTCRILDYGKYKYDISKKKKESSKKQRESIVKLKQIKLRPNTDQNDLKTKAANAERFIEEGDRVKISIFFRGREITHKDVGMDTLRQFVEMVPNMRLVGDPSMQGKVLSAIGSKRP